MPTKTSNSTENNSKNTSHQKLTPLEKKLLECAENGQPVLLYSKDTFNRKGLILKIHKLNGGIDSAYEYFDEIGNLVSRREFIESLNNREMRYHYHIRSTSKTWDYIDCRGMKANEVFGELVEHSKIERGELDGYEEKAIAERMKALNSLSTWKISNKKPGTFFNCCGLLFIDNLIIYPGDDISYYDKLAVIIESKLIEYKITAFDWLVVYTHNPEDLPQCFRKQFKAIDLEQKLIISFDDNKKAITINNKEHSDIPSREYELFKLLHENKKRLLSKHKIMEHLETGGEWSESQVFKLITEIRKKFGKDGIQIKNVKETKNQLGGYQMII